MMKHGKTKEEAESRPDVLVINLDDIMEDFNDK